MAIHPQALTRAARTRTATGALIDRSTGPTTNVCFATGDHAAKITKLKVIVDEDFVGASSAIDIGYLTSNGDVSSDSDAYTPTALDLEDADRWFDDTGAALDIDNLSGFADVLTGYMVEFDVNASVAKNTIVTITHPDSDNAGTYYWILEYEIVQEHPAEL